MNTDIRISVSFRNHRKRRKLRLLIGPGATDYLIDLWISTAMNHPSGRLDGMDAIDIALDAGWEQDPATFVDALSKAGFIDRDADGTYMLHDWADHQGYAVHADARHARAKKAAEKRWGVSGDAPSIQNDAPSIQNDAPSNAPIPIPIPIPPATEKPVGVSAGAVGATSALDAPPAPIASLPEAAQGRPTTAKRKKIDRSEMRPDWSPADSTLALLGEQGIPPDFATSCLPEFRLYWIERAEKRPGWEATFLNRVRSEWERSAIRRSRAAQGGGRDLAQRPVADPRHAEMQAILDGLSRPVIDGESYVTH